MYFTVSVVRRRLIAKSLPDVTSIDKLPYTNYDYSYVSQLYTQTSVSISLHLSPCLYVDVVKRLTTLTTYSVVTLLS